MYKILAKTLFLGKQVIYMPTCHSTNDIAMNMLKNPDTSEGCLVITDNQMAGRGQRGNSWLSTPKLNLTFSLILKPNFLPIKDQFSLNIAISLAVADTLKDLLPEKDVKVKWPNDIYVGEHKIAGILLENTLRPPFLEYSVSGIGLNVNQRSFDLPRTTSIITHTGSETELSTLLESLVMSIEQQYLQLKSNRLDILKTDYLTNLFGFGVPRKFQSEFEFTGVIEGVTKEGKLIVASDGRSAEYDLQEIKFL